MTSTEKKVQYFSRACSLLSKMVKEKRTEEHQPRWDPPTTMDLLPKIDATDDARPEDDSSQLTIFYGGNVFVFDGFAAERAKDLMQMATDVSTAAGGDKSGLRMTDLLVQTRRASVDRFLCKRRERIHACAPYQVRGSLTKMGATAKPEDAPSWLGLGHEISKSPKA